MGFSTLSIACGSGWWEIKSLFEHPVDKLYLLDKNPEVLNWPDVQEAIAYFEKAYQKPFPAKIELFIQEANNIPLPNHSIQEIWLFNSLHEIQEKEICLKECYRLLEPGGIIFIEEELSLTERRHHEGCHLPLFFLDELTQLMKASGFQFLSSEQKDDKAFYVRYSKP